jgi:hypothetical protein
MDETRKYFFVFFGLFFIAIFGATVMYLEHLYEDIKRTAEVILLKSPVLLKSPDLEHRQIVGLPYEIQGKLSTDSDVIWICWIYNPKELRQNVTIIWNLAYQVEDEKIYINYYNSKGTSFVIDPWNCEEVQLSFRIKEGTPKKAINKLELTKVIITDVKTEFVF